ncbi:hypothetical protein M7I_2645 [Glarea lozoyensis 74030]|uniref:Uncharacterized protein n=1 Tax=Glarea lozoyensis (strain ATCC 74030 / MF5533) TaxID=1104152 RepID=H0EJC1_GLAL7|nr:hypothetical protein M7I_2645 [Glarea lozoyensis 74030]
MGQPKAGPPDENRGRIHCETRENKATEWNFGFDELRLASQRAAAAACASVAPVSTLIGRMLQSVGNLASRSSHYFSKAEQQNGRVGYME